jgi:hypothetical protein
MYGIYFSFIPEWLPAFELWSGHVGFVVDKVTQGQVLSEYFGFSLPMIPPTAPHSSSSILGEGSK